MWYSKKFSELSTDELFKILYLRTKVFVVDQNRVYQEVDKHDPEAIHIFDLENGQIVAYARVFNQNDKVTFGRVLTSPDYRGQGLGNELMQHILNTIKKDFPKKEVEIDAQVQVEGFYQKFHFQTQGSAFLFNHTPHLKMTHEMIS